MRIILKNVLGTSLLCAASFAANATETEIYTSVGLPGLIVGYSNPINDKVSLRADLATLGSPTQHRTIEAIDYDIKLKADRLALLADWFVSGGFRLTGGVTLNHARGDFQGHDNGGTITIGGNSYVAGSSDQFDVHVVYPNVMPYLGIGYGHAPSNSTGWGFLFDIGLSIGKPTVTGTASGPLLSQTVAQQDVDSELARVRDDAAKLHGIPQLSIGASYRF